jgi:hypothetical protein
MAARGRQCALAARRLDRSTRLLQGSIHTRDAAFEWDDVKAAKNFAKHNVTFDAARDVFDDSLALDWVDAGQDEGEQRFKALGISNGRLMVVAYAIGGDVTRIISARLAEPFERRRYHEQHRT